MNRIIITALLCMSVCLESYGDCPLDHFRIGCNQDGVFGTEDDTKLFFDCTEKYRHSDPDHSGDPTWMNWYYPMYYNERYDRYQIGEPGFDLIDQSDPNRQLSGVPNVDYRVIIECVAISPEFSARNSAYGIVLDEPGDWFNHSGMDDSHLHIQYRVGSAYASRLHWVTFIMYDAIDDGDKYQISEPMTVVFMKEPLSGDLVVDGIIDGKDLVELSYYWLRQDGAIENDFYERTDIDKDGIVNIGDFALLASNWLKTLD